MKFLILLCVTLLWSKIADSQLLSIAFSDRLHQNFIYFHKSDTNDFKLGDTVYILSRTCVFRGQISEIAKSSEEDDFLYGPGNYLGCRAKAITLDTLNIQIGRAHV